jgi:hypothetical protein
MARSGTSSRRAAPRVDKLIVTHRGALKAKYGARRSEVVEALKRLVAADAARGLRSKVVFLDDAAALRAAKGKPAIDPADERAAKSAIDALYRRHQPDYLLLVGAWDVVPHIALRNPMNADADPDNDDDDEDVPSDLPYACEAAFARQPQRFLGPTRVVGRLPDLPFASAPDALLRLIETAIAHTSRPGSDYVEGFALSARVWVDSTELSVRKLFGANAPLHTSPTSGPRWSRRDLAPRIHFINCHGNTLDPNFLGEGPTDTYHLAHQSARLEGRVSEGAVVAAECCYGAELYDPADAEGKPGICSTYLAQGAYGFFGSTCIAYGPAEGNGQADLVCQFFVEGVQGGASLGRATLEARQRFIAQYSHHDPADLKTLLQFLLLGDPSVHPVQAPQHALARSETMAKARRTKLLQPSARAFRRERLARTGINLSRSIGAAVPAALKTPAPVRALLMAAAKESGLQAPRIRTWRVEFPAGAARDMPAGIGASRGLRSIHAISGRRTAAETTSGSDARAPRAVTAIIATLESDRVVHVRRVHSR